jgi:hypothetical protein
MHVPEGRVSSFLLIRLVKLSSDILYYCLYTTSAHMYNI